jgi:hypothetical protein
MESQDWRPGEELPPDLVVAYEEDIREAAREVIERIDAQPD